MISKKEQRDNNGFGDTVWDRPPVQVYSIGGSSQLPKSPNRQHPPKGVRVSSLAGLFAPIRVAPLHIRCSGGGDIAICSARFPNIPLH